MTVEDMTVEEMDAAADRGLGVVDWDGDRWVRRSKDPARWVLACGAPTAPLSTVELHAGYGAVAVWGPRSLIMGL